jgi:hypothetical protein
MIDYINFVRDVENEAGGKVDWSKYPGLQKAMDSIVNFCMRKTIDLEKAFTKKEETNFN